LRERSTVARTNDPPALPPRVPGGHKGSFGDALFVAGSREYTGAPVLATMAHLRCGGGYARLAAPAAVGGALASGAREVVFHAQPQTATGSLSATCLPGLLAAAARSDIVVMGPGLSLDTEVRTVVLEAIRQVAAPLVLDGDALTHLAGSPETAVERTGALVLTPHPGEHARLLGWSLERVLDQRVQAVREAVSRYRAVVVAKGAHTLIGCPDGSLYVNLTGNNGMGTAGSGDVLTGTITAMHGLGLSLDLAARAAVFVHGLAGDLAATEMGADGMVASDILRMLPKAVRELRERRAELERDCYGKILRA
jgi:NAD(P)H-hydrate epimerase